MNKLKAKYLMSGSAFFIGVILNGCGSGNKSSIPAQTPSEVIESAIEDNGAFNQGLIINSDNKPLLNFITGIDKTESSLLITLNNTSERRIENIKLSLPQQFSLNRSITNGCNVIDHQLVSDTLAPLSSCNLIISYNDPSVINKTIASLTINYNYIGYYDKKIQNYELYYSTMDNDFEWHLLGNNEQTLSRGDNFIGAWNAIRQLGKVPGESVTIAVIDTGYTPHPNYLSNLHSNGLNNYGYDFKDPTNLDGLDLGDFVAQNECGENSAKNSGWHGSHVTGIIVGNGLDGIYGGAYGAKVVPIRALGKCGGTTSEISNAIMWAIDEYPGISNPHPADIINMSLGGKGTCSDSYKAAIETALSKGVVVVVSAGNSTDDVSKYRPANCPGVISVAALAAKNKLAAYSNYGNTSIAAAGGDGLQSILSAIWNSKTEFNLNDGGSYGGKSGTSMAAPNVSAAIADVISLLKAYNKPYTPAIIEEIIKNSAQSDFQKYSSDQSKSTTSNRLDVEEAVKYTINNYLKTNN